MFVPRLTFAEPADLVGDSKVDYTPIIRGMIQITLAGAEKAAGIVYDSSDRMGVEYRTRSAARRRQQFEAGEDRAHGEIAVIEQQVACDAVLEQPV